MVRHLTGTRSPPVPPLSCASLTTHWYRANIAAGRSQTDLPGCIAVSFHLETVNLRPTQQILSQVRLMRCERAVISDGQNHGTFGAVPGDDLRTFAVSLFD